MAEFDPIFEAPKCTLGQYLDSPFHKEVERINLSPDQHYLEERDLYAIRNVASRALNSSHPADSPESALLFDAFVHLHSDPAVEKKVLDDLAMPDPQQIAPVADLIIRKDAVQGLELVPGCRDQNAKVQAINFTTDAINPLTNSSFNEQVVMDMLMDGHGPYVSTMTDLRSK